MHSFKYGSFLRNSAVFTVFILILSLCSCKTLNSFDLYVPNEANIHRKNIASEYYQIAEAYADLKKYDKAIIYYKRAMRDSGFKKASYYKLGRMNVLSNNFDEAEKIFKNLLKTDSENQTLKMSLAYCYGKNRKITKALKIYSDLLVQNSDSSDIMVNYIYLLIADDNLEEAQSQLLILKQKFPDLKQAEDLQNKIYKSLKTEETD